MKLLITIIFSFIFLLSVQGTTWDICAGCPSSSPDSGNVIGTVTSSYNGSNLILSIELTESFEEVHIWYGSLDDLPTLPSGGLAFGQFPYKYTSADGEVNHYVSIPLELNCGDELNLVVHLAMSSGETAIAGGSSGSNTNDNAVQWDGNRWGWTLLYTVECDNDDMCNCSMSGTFCAGCPHEDAGYTAGYFDIILNDIGELVITITPSLDDNGNLRCFNEIHIWLSPDELSTYSPGQFPFKYDGEFCEQQIITLTQDDLSLDNLCDSLYLAIHLAMADGETAWAVLKTPFDSSRWGWYGQWCPTDETIQLTTIPTPIETTTIGSIETTQSSKVHKKEKINGKVIDSNKRNTVITAESLKTLLEDVVDGDVSVANFEYDYNTRHFNADIELIADSQYDIDKMIEKLMSFINNGTYNEYNIEYMVMVPNDDEQYTVVGHDTSSGSIVYCSILISMIIILIQIII